MLNVRLEKLTTAIISGLVAITLFCATQVFLNLRSRQDLLRKKLEELFAAMSDVSLAFVSIQEAIFSKDEDGTVEGGRRLNEKLYKPRELLLLYFPYVVPIWEATVVSQMQMITEALNAAESVDDLDKESTKQMVTSATLNIRGIQNFLARNQEMTTESFKFNLRRTFRRRLTLRIPKQIYDQLIQKGSLENGMLKGENIAVEQDAAPQIRPR